MKLSHIPRSRHLLAIAIVAVLASAAASADGSDWYVGGSYGQSQSSIDEQRIADELFLSGLAATSIANDDSDRGYKAFVGYRFNDYLGMEFGYFDLGEFGFAASTVPAGSLVGAYEVSGMNLDLVARMPLGERLSVIGRVGANHAKTDARIAGGGAAAGLSGQSSASGTNLKYGLGLQFDFNDSVAIRLEGERYRIEDALGDKNDIDLVSLGLVFGFGRDEQEYVARAPEPMPMPAPMPAPAPAPQPSCADLDNDGDGVNNCNDKCPSSQAGQAIGADGCPVVLTIDLKGVNFDFDRDTLRPDAVLILDEAVSILQRYPNLRVEVAGHTDAKGTDGYNQDLSQRRSRVVHDYLSSRGIDPGRLAGPNGYGESRPIAPNENSDGSDNPEGRARNRRTELNVQN